MTLSSAAVPPSRLGAEGGKRPIHPVMFSIEQYSKAMHDATCI